MTMLAWLLVGSLLGEAPAKVSAAARDEDGFLVHAVASPYQGGETKIRVLMPQRADGTKPSVVVYVLPVEAGDESRYGNGLKEVKARGLHEKYDAVFVAPTFDRLPWYADHPSDALIRQESHLLKVVVPFVDRTYLADRPQARHLLGFSKSGWGAFSLLLRNPETFGKAVAWDAPFMMDAPGKYGSGPIFGGAANFEGYRLTRLFKERGKALGDSPRLILLGHGNFKAEHVAAERLLNELKLPHVNVDGPMRPHVWESGWVPEAAELLGLPRTKKGQADPKSSQGNKGTTVTKP